MHYLIELNKIDIDLQSKRADIVQLQRQKNSINHEIANLKLQPKTKKAIIELRKQKNNINTNIATIRNEIKKLTNKKMDLRTFNKQAKATNPFAYTLDNLKEYY